MKSINQEEWNKILLEKVFFRKLTRIEFQYRGSPQIHALLYRVEFQYRGSPQIHALLWIKDAPIYGQNEKNEALDYIDRISS